MTTGDFTLNLRRISIILGACVILGIATFTWHEFRTQHETHPLRVSPYDVCIHMKHLIHEGATQRMLAQKDVNSDAMATVEGIANINAFSMSKCADSMYSLQSKAPAEYSIRTRCLSAARDEATANLCVRN